MDEKLENGKDDILIIPCSGVERNTGQLSSLITTELANTSQMFYINIEPSLAQIVSNSEKYLQGIKTKKIVIVDGCGQKCASKIINGFGLKPFGLFSIPQLLKGKGFSPENPKKLTDKELKLIPEITRDLALNISDLLNRKTSERMDLNSFEFVPQYEDWMEYRKEKFIFKVPVKEKGFYYSWNDAWAYIADNLIVVGITDYLQQNIGDITIIELPDVGQNVEQLEALSSIETIKTVIDLIAPFSGRVVKINQMLIDEPERVNQDPYKDGWICVIEPSEFKEELENNMTPKEYFEFMKSKIDEE